MMRNITEYKKKSGSPKDEWTPVGLTGRRVLKDQCVYARLRKQKSGNFLLSVMLGNEIVELLGYDNCERVMLYTHRSNPKIFMIKKNPDGYMLCSSKGSYVKRFCVPVDAVDFPLNATIKIDFDIVDDETIVINLERK